MDNRDKSFNSNMPFRPQLPHPSRMELNWDPYAHGVTTPPPRLSPVRPPLLHLFLSVPSLPTPNLLGFYLRLQMLVIIPDLIIAWDTGNKESLAHVIWGSIALHCLGQGVRGWRHPHLTQTSQPAIFNLRKSITCNPTFFTEEGTLIHYITDSTWVVSATLLNFVGVLDSSELSLLRPCLVPKKICTVPVTSNLRTNAWSIKCSWKNN